MRFVRCIVAVFLLTGVIAPRIGTTVGAQEDDPATSCDVRKAGLDPAKFHVYLTKDTPYTGWSRWPEMSGGSMPGTAPHGAWHATWVNPVARRSLEEGTGMAFGSLLVAEGFESDGSLRTLSAMLKIRGYNPEEGDWHWFQYDAEGRVLACGRENSCVGCHRAARENDYVLAAPVRR